jgi:cytochrome c oxidase assembly protein subunit 15
VSIPEVSPGVYRRITLAGILAQVFIVLTGAAVRLTGSGLGCSDWPTCEDDRLVAPLEGHALIEFVNRTVSGVVLIAVLAAIIGARKRSPYRADLFAISLALLAGVAAQIVLGGIVVRLDLAPVAVIGHFLLSIVLIWLAVLLHERAGHDGGAAKLDASVASRRWAGAAVGASIVVVLTGTLVTATGPHGGDTRADRLSWFDITEIVRVHAVSAIVLLAFTLAALSLIYRDGGSPAQRLRAAWVTAAIVIQGVLGYTQYFMGVPELLVFLHVFGALIVWITVLRLYLGLFDHASQPGGRPSSMSDAVA